MEYDTGRCCGNILELELSFTEIVVFADVRPGIEFPSER